MLLVQQYKHNERTIMRNLVQKRLERKLSEDVIKRLKEEAHGSKVLYYKLLKEEAKNGN